LKKVIVCLITVAGISTVNYLCALVTNTAFIELSAIIGLISALIIKFLTTSGGFSSNAVRLQLQSQTGMKVDEDKKKFRPSLPFYTAIVYTLIAIIVTFVHYKDYFI
jgi:hypothetical protein